MIIIVDVDRDENYGQLCSYLKLIMCIFYLKLVPTTNMCFNYCQFFLLFTIYYSGSKSADSRRRRRLEYNGSGVSNEKKAREEDESGVPRNDKKSEVESKYVKFEL